MAEDADEKDVEALEGMEMSGPEGEKSSYKEAVPSTTEVQTTELSLSERTTN